MLCFDGNLHFPHAVLGGMHLSGWTLEKVATEEKFLTGLNLPANNVDLLWQAMCASAAFNPTNQLYMMAHLFLASCMRMQGCTVTDSSKPTAPVSAHQTAALRSPLNDHMQVSAHIFFKALLWTWAHQGWGCASKQHS